MTFFLNFYFHFHINVWNFFQGLVTNATKPLFQTKVEMEAFFEKNRLLIAKKSEPNANGCRIWLGTLKRGPIRYGVVNAKFPDGKWRNLHVHRLRYLVYLQVLALAPGLDVSHLCHEPLCVALEHLSIEPHHLNLERQRCVNREHCIGHKGFRGCMLW